MSDKPYVPYPKWLYHPNGESRLVNSPDEREALGDEWRETPAAEETTEKEPMPESESAPQPDPASQTDQTPEPAPRPTRKQRAPRRRRAG